MRWLLAFALLAAHVADAQPERLTRLDGTTVAVTDVEQTITQLMAAARVTGFAIAVIERGEVTYAKAFGERDTARHLPLEVDTVMYGASFSKAMFGTVVAELAQRGVIDLDRPVIELLKRPWSQVPRYTELARDPRAARITARMLLNHTAGFANLRYLEPDNRLHIHFEPGTRYAYSGDGINLLQLVVEAVTGQTADALLRAQLFAPLGMTRTSMTWQPRLADHTAIGYDRRGRPLGHVQRSAARAAGSIDTTITDVAAFLVAMMRGTAISAEAKRLALTPGIAIHTARQFPTLELTPSTAYDKVGLAYGLGWGLLTRTPYGPAYFKEGHDDGWAGYCIAFDQRGLGVVVMTNSDNGESIFRAVLDKVMKNDVTPWAWEGY